MAPPFYVGAVTRLIAQLDAAYAKMRPTKVFSRLVSHVFFQGRPLVSKGQWLNHPLSVMLRLATKGPQFCPVRKPIFIIGTGRSGTTILGKVLSMHRDVGFLNEPKLLWHIVFPYEDIIGSYTRRPAHYRLDERHATSDVHQAAARLYGLYLATTGSRRVLDKYPAMIFRSDFVQAIFENPVFLFLVRHGWDTIHSIASWSHRNRVVKDGETHDWWGRDDRKWRLLVNQIILPNPVFDEIHSDVRSLSRDIDKAAVEWIATMREGLRLLETIPEQVHLIRYEDITAHPRQALKAIVDLCELPPDDKLLAYAQAVLKPTWHRERPDLCPFLEPLFEETLSSLGYAS